MRDKIQSKRERETTPGGGRLRRWSAVGGQGMEKRVAGIVRWLERFQRAYRSGAIESALMDAECARADLETLRRDVWSALDPSCLPRRRRAPLGRAVVSALLVVLATAVPVSVAQRERGFEEAGEPLPYDSLFAWSVLNLRTAGPSFDGASEVAETGSVLTPSSALVASQPKPPLAPPRAHAEPRPGSGLRPLGKNGGEGARSAEGGKKDEKKGEKKVPYETVFALLQTGERVLKNERPVIAVDRRQGKGEGGL